MKIKSISNRPTLNNHHQDFVTTYIMIHVLKNNTKLDIWYLYVGIIFYNGGRLNQFDIKYKNHMQRCICLFVIISMEQI